MNVPVITYELIEWLDAVFPRRAFNPDDCLPAIMFSSGQSSVVDKLRAHYAEQQEDFNVHPEAP